MVLQVAGGFLMKGWMHEGASNQAPPPTAVTSLRNRRQQGVPMQHQAGLVRGSRREVARPCSCCVAALVPCSIEDVRACAKMIWCQRSEH